MPFIIPSKIRKTGVQGQTRTITIEKTQTVSKILSKEELKLQKSLREKIFVENELKETLSKYLQDAMALSNTVQQYSSSIATVINADNQLLQNLQILKIDSPNDTIEIEIQEDSELPVLQRLEMEMKTLFKEYRELSELNDSLLKKNRQMIQEKMDKSNSIE